MPVREKGRRSPGSLPARPFSRPQPPADRRQSAGLFAYSLRVHCRDRLAAGGRRIRTAGPTVNGADTEGRPTPTIAPSPRAQLIVPASLFESTWDREFESTLLQRGVCLCSEIQSCRRRAARFGGALWVRGHVRRGVPHASRHHLALFLCRAVMQSRLGKAGSSMTRKPR